LEFPEEVGEQEGHVSGPTPSTTAKTESAISGKKRGQHGRHKVHKKVHAIHRIGPHGEPLEPESVIGPFSNQCSCIVREHVQITYSDWRKVLDDLKGAVWGEVKRRFKYPEDQFDEDVCKRHALFIAGKALRNLRSTLNKKYVQKGKTPYADYNFIKRHVWEEIVEKMTTDESKAKSKKFFDQAKMNELPHHLGPTGYVAKKKWRQEEREAAASGQENPLLGIDKRGRDYFNARRPKRLKKGRTKYNEPKTEVAEKALIAVNASKERGDFKPHREHDLLTEALGNPSAAAVFEAYPRG
jgi:hypothetical protein